MEMIIIGSILMAVGLGTMIFGFVRNNDLEAQLASAFSTGSLNPGTIWIVLGFVVLAAGLVLLLLGLNKRAGAAPGMTARPAPAVREILCPCCGRRVEASLSFCTSCGANLKKARPEAAPRAKLDAEQVCPFCESILRPGAMFCPACGRPVASSPTASRPASAPHPTPARTAPTPSYTPATSPAYVPAPGPSHTPPPAHTGISNGWGTPTDDDL